MSFTLLSITLLLLYFTGNLSFSGLKSSTLSDNNTAAVAPNAQEEKLRGTTITFNKNDPTATGSMTPQTLASGTSAKLTANRFTKSGHTFAGWATTADGSVAYINGASYTMGTASTTLYAKWTPVPATYTVTFDSGDTAKMPITKSVVPPATTVRSLPANPIKTGYIFGGWYTAVNGGGTQFTATTPVTASIRVYAQWTPVPAPYIVTFDSGNSAKVPTTKSVLPPATTVGSLPANPVKTGSTFSGWYTAANGGGTQFTATTPVKANIRVYAKWIPIAATYTVTYSVGDAAKIYSQKTVVPPATTVRIQPSNPTKTGYTFGGWYTAANGGGTQFTATTPVKSDMTVYAKWTSR